MHLTSSSPEQKLKGLLLAKGADTYKQNKLLKTTLQLLVKNLLAQFNARSYDGNKILRLTKERIDAQPDSPEKQDLLQIWVQIQLFIWNLSICPKYWVMMFEKEEFYSVESQCIDMHVFTNKIYKFVIGQTSKLTIFAELLGDIVSEYLFMLFQEVSSQIVDCYERSRKIIMKETKEIEQVTKKSKIMNFYVIYKLLLQISQNCQAEIVYDLSTSIFKNIQSKYSQQFADYILQKHEVLSLAFDQRSSKKKYEDNSPLIDIMERIKKSNNVKWRQAVREDGQSAIIVEFDNKEEAPPENYMIKMDKNGRIKVMNCNTVRRKWKVTEAAQKNDDILNIVSQKGSLAKKLRNSPTKLKEITMTDHFSTVGGALGKCLADIKKYDSVGDFVFDLSKKSIVNGTFNYVATNIPLIGILFATGGYTYTLFGIFSNKHVHVSKKFKQMGYMTFDIASSLGTGLLGAAVGQTLIPVPFLGAFVGGVVGSFIGQIGGRAITNKLESMRFKRIIDKLQSSIKPGGYWQVDKDLLKTMGLDWKNFYQTIPPQLEGRLGADKLWFAMISFTILSFNESKKRAKFLKEQMEQIEKQRKQNKEIDVDKVKEKLHYEASSDLVCIMKYFQNSKVNLISCFKELEEEVIEIFALME